MKFNLRDYKPDTPIGSVIHVIKNNMYNEKPIVDELAALKKAFIDHEEGPDQKFSLALQSLMYLLVHLKKRIDASCKTYSLDTLSILLDELSKTPLTPTVVWFDEKQNVNVLHVVARTPYDCSSLLDKVAEIFKDYYAELLLSQDTFGFTPLNAACKDKNLPAALQFISKGRELLTPLDFNLMLTTENNDGFTPLHSAYESATLLTILIENVNESSRAEYISQKNDKGYTAFHNACRYGMKDSAVILLNNGSRWDVTDRVDQSTPLHSACWAGKDEIMQLFLDEIHEEIASQGSLEKYKRCVLAQTNKNDNALHKAAYYNHKIVIDMLLKIATTLDGTPYSPTLYALATQKDKQGNTPLDIMYNNQKRAKSAHEIYDSALGYLAKYCTEHYTSLTRNIFKDCNQNNIPAFTSLIYQAKTYLPVEMFKIWVTKENGEIIDVPVESRKRIARYLKDLESLSHPQVSENSRYKFFSASAHSPSDDHPLAARYSC